MLDPPTSIIYIHIYIYVPYKFDPDGVKAIVTIHSNRTNSMFVDVLSEASGSVVSQCCYSRLTLESTDVESICMPALRV